MPELFKFTTAEQFQSFVKEVLALKELIKCPVCLDSTKNAVRISCDHVFCNECLDTFVNTFKDQAPTKIPQCPICRKAVNRQRKAVNSYVESALKFIDAASTQVQAIFGCDISLLTNIRDIEDALKTRNDNDKNLRTSRRTSTDSSNVIQPTEDQDRRIDVFDRLMNIAAAPKPVVKKKYARKSKNATTDKNKVSDENKVVIFDTIQNFENEESRESIAQWLHDTKNNFERKTQTQDVIGDDENVMDVSFDVPSVSQDSAPRLIEDPKKRPRSLEVTVTKPLVKVKRHSFCGQSEEMKKVVIDDDSDEKNKDKVEVLGKDVKSGKQKLRKGKGVNEGKSSKNKTGWGRIEKINKTINRNTRQTKMLPVSLTASTPKDRDLSAVNPVVVLTKFQEVECFEKKNSDAKTTFKMNENDNVELENDIIELTDNSANKQENRKENTVENFESLTNKAWEKSEKLLSGNIFSDDDDDPICSVQCSKPEHITCRKPVNFKTPEKIEVNRTLVDDAFSTIEELKSFLNTSNAQKVKSCISKLKLIVDHLNKTTNKSQNSSVAKTLISTQTVNFDEMKSVCVQTDTPSDSGFRISSAEAFKTRELFEKEVQTEKFNCPNCENAKTPKTNKYEFTQSFDNIDFDTQNLVNKSKINFSQISTQKIPTQQQKIPTQLQKIPTQLQKIPSETKIINSDEITNDPREEINIPSQIKSTSETVRSCLEISLSNGSRIDERVRLKESVSAALKTYKRIRTLESDDGESESISKKKRLENKYLADNLSIEMLSEDVLEGDGESLKATDGSLSLDKCEEVDYDAYLNNIMKKYDDKPTTNQNQNKQALIEPKPSTSKKTESQDVMERCEAMLRNAETKKSNADPIDTINLKKIQHQTPNDNDNHEMIEIEEDEEEEESPELVRESPIDVAIEDEFNEPFEELPKSAVFKLSTESFMANMDIDNLPVTKIDKSALQIMDVDDEPVISNVEALIEEYGRDFCEKNHEEKFGMGSSKVTVLQNIILSPRHQKVVSMNSERSEELFNSDMEEDVIEGTPKRKRVVERRLFSQTKPASQRKLLLPLPPPEDSPDIISLTNPTAFLDQTFAPPTEFQDLGDIETKSPSNQPSDPDDLDVTMVPANQPTAPNLKNTQHNPETREPDNQTEFLSLTESEMMRFLSNQEKNVITSTQRSRVITSTQKTHAGDIEIGVSPIRFERKRLNPVDVAKQSKFSPLDVVAVKSQTPQKTVTPAQTKQKSILSFMRQESRNNSLDESVCSTGSTELMPAPMKVTKPCISCTRLNKEQILVIMALTKKKLATYSNSFGENVTHMVVSVNENNCIFDHTMKYLMAVATGKWVVSFEWIRECLNQNKIVPEVGYEALDVSSLPGPRNSRIYGKRMPLFLGYKIHLVPPFMSAAKEEIEQLITFMGGELVQKLETISKLSGIRIIVMEAKSTQDYFECEEWLETYRLITVDVEWLTRTIGQFKVLSLRSFALCTDDNIESLGYPLELIAETQSMHTPSTGATK